MNDLDLGQAYSEARRRIAVLVTDADPTARVPATPAWDVHDLIAHVTGIAVDGTTGNMAGAPGDAWTAAQVHRNRGRAVADMVDEWLAATGPLMDAFLSSPEGSMAEAAVIDLHTHEADLRHALALPLHVPEPFLGWVAQRFRVGFADAVSTAGLSPVTVDAPAVEWFRGRLGRRTVDEVCAYGWSADPTLYLDLWFVFGRAGRSLGEG